MGGWLACHLALLRPERVDGAGRNRRRARFHRWGFKDGDEAERQGLGRGFWESGQQLLLLDGEIADRLPGAADPRRERYGRADRRRVPNDGAAPFSRCPAEVSRAAAIACRSRTRSTRSCAPSPACWSLKLDPILAAALAAAAASGARLSRRRSPRRRSSAERSRRRSRRPTKPRLRLRGSCQAHRPTRIRQGANVRRGRQYVDRGGPGRQGGVGVSTGRWPLPGHWRPSSAARPCSTVRARPRRKATSRPRARS